MRLAVFLDIRVQTLHCFVAAWGYNVSNIEYDGGWGRLAMSRHAEGVRRIQDGAVRGPTRGCRSGGIEGMCVQKEKRKAASCV